MKMVYSDFIVFFFPLLTHDFALRKRRHASHKLTSNRSFGCNIFEKKLAFKNCKIVDECDYLLQDIFCHVSDFIKRAGN